MGSINTRRSRPGPIRERWVTSRPTKSNRVPGTTATSSAVPNLRRTVSARAVSCKTDERMSIVIGDRAEVITRQSAVAVVERDPAASPSIVVVPGYTLLPTPPPPSEVFVFGAAARSWSWPLPEERITALDGADADPTAMTDYNLDDDDCEFLQRERAARMRLGLDPLNFDEDHFEAVLDSFAVAEEPVTDIAGALMLAPQTADTDLVEAALRHWRKKKESDNKVNVVMRHKIGTYPCDRPDDPYVVFRPLTAPSPTTRSTTRAKRKGEDERESEGLKKKVRILAMQGVPRVILRRCDWSG